MADNLQAKVVEAVEALPAESEIGLEFDAYKETLAAVDHDGWKDTLQYMIARGHARLRVTVREGVKTVYIRKAR